MSKYPQGLRWIEIWFIISSFGVPVVILYISHVTIPQPFYTHVDWKHIEFELSQF